MKIRKNAKKRNENNKKIIKENNRDGEGEVKDIDIDTDDIDL